MGMLRGSARTKSHSNDCLATIEKCGVTGREFWGAGRVVEKPTNPLVHLRLRCKDTNRGREGLRARRFIFFYTK